MHGYLALILHAHLPFVRHPEHERFLEENWLYEAITETYLPLLQILRGWEHDGIRAPLTLSLSPTLCSMLLDPLLCNRYDRHINGLVELSQRETHRTLFDRTCHDLACMYNHRFTGLRETWLECDRDLVSAFRRLQDAGRLEIITTAATHGLLPLLASHAPSVRGQILVARDHYRDCFGRNPRGIWLPECAYVNGIENVLQEADIRWFTVDTHGILNARPRPRYGVFAPVFTPNGVAAFGRDLESAKQVWSRDEGYPGDPRYRDFYRDIGFDLDFDYVHPYLPGEQRGFTGIKYYRITGGQGSKEIYHRNDALYAASQHAGHFLNARVKQVESLFDVMKRPPLIVSPYDAELFGHWWYEGPEFLDSLMRKTALDQQTVQLTTPGEYLNHNATLQVVEPSPSSWGEEGYWRVWLNETNEWIYPHLRVAQQRMTQLARKFGSPTPLQERALRQAARELLLAQSSDWPFILRTGTSPGYARKRVTDHLLRFLKLYEGLMSGKLDGGWLTQTESIDNLFPDVNWRNWV
jgi:1,4-alpha-glucan branching enzyme